MSISLIPGDIRRLDELARRHSVTRSQIIWDAIKSLDGELHELVASLRNELQDQKRSTANLVELAEEQRKELARLGASQALVDAVLNPYKAPDGTLSKPAQERLRVLRAFLRRDELRDRLEHLVANGQDAAPFDPTILKEAKAAYGSLEAFHHAVKKALEEEK